MILFKEFALRFNDITCDIYRVEAVVYMLMLFSLYKVGIQRLMKDKSWEKERKKKGKLNK